MKRLWTILRRLLPASDGGHRPWAAQPVPVRVTNPGRARRRS